ncbi:MAG: phosphatase PAP2 family protein [Clostridia bacterium]|nr:phosphatase PAP2 family protein [Clostridia bacterium]
MKKKAVAAAVFCALFVIFTVLVRTVGVSVVGPGDAEVGFSSVNTAARDAIGVRPSLYKLTEYLGYAAIAVAAVLAALGVGQFIKRKSLFRVDGELLALGGLYAAALFFYSFFEIVKVNYRPVLEEGKTVPEASYPSSHTMLVAVILIGAALVAGRYLGRRAAAAVSVFFALITCVTVVGRVLSGVHWITDIVGGALIAAALLFAFSAVLDGIPKKE